jgi:Glycosyl transferase family 2
MPRQVACAYAQNTALAAVTTEWVMRLADDDWLLPRAIRLLLEEAHHADVIFAPSHNGAGGIRNVNDWSQAKLVEWLKHSDVMGPSGELYRTEVLRRWGGWPTDFHHGHFHHFQVPYCLSIWEDFAIRSALAYCGARFRYVDYPTWCVGDDAPSRIGDGRYDWSPCPSLATG